MTDNELLKKARQGDNAAVNRILQMYQPMVRSIASHFFLSGGDRDDVIQEGMIGLFSAIGTYNTDGQASFTTYAYTCVRNAIRDAVKRDNNSGHTALNNSVPILEIYEGLWNDNPEDEIIRRETKLEFMKKISEILSAYEFQVVTLHLEGLSTAEMTVYLNKDAKSVDNALSRAKTKIGKLYSAEE